MRFMLRQIVVLMAALGAGATAAQTLPPGPKVAVTAVTQSSPTIAQFTRVDQPMLADVAKRTNGRIEFTVRTFTEMNLGGAEILRLVRSGQVDIAMATLTTVSGDVPLLDGFDLAGMNLTADQARKVADALVPYANKELERLGVRIISTFPFFGQIFYCNKPIAGMADLKGLKVRSFGPSLGDMLQAIGAQPVSIPIAEVYPALERGTVDCAATGSGNGYGTRLFDVSTHQYTMVWSWATAAQFANLAWWNRLDPPVRAYIEGVYKEIQEAQWKLGAEGTQDGIDCNAGRAAGCKIGSLPRRAMVEVKPTAADTEMLRKVLSQNVLPNWVKRCGANCGELYNQVVAPITGVRYGG